jgi:transposase
VTEAVRCYAKTWRRRRSSSLAQAYVPLIFSPGEAYQFDWSHEFVVLAGVTTKIKVAHLRLCHSRMFLVSADPRESQEMVFDAHERAFRLFDGAWPAGHLRQHEDGGGFIGKDRAFNRRFLQMCGHYLAEPVACTPGAGWGEAD